MSEPIKEIFVVKRIDKYNKEYCVALTKEEYQKEQLQATLRADSWKYRNQYLSQFE